MDGLRTTIRKDKADVQRFLMESKWQRSRKRQTVVIYSRIERRLMNYLLDTDNGLSMSRNSTAKRRGLIITFSDHHAAGHHWIHSFYQDACNMQPAHRLLRILDIGCREAPCCTDAPDPRTRVCCRGQVPFSTCELNLAIHHLCRFGIIQH